MNGQSLNFVPTSNFVAVRGIGIMPSENTSERYDSEEFDETSLGNDVLPLEQEELDYEDVLDGVFDHDDQPETQC